MNPECKRVVVGWRDCRSRCSSYVCKDYFGGSVAADGAEVRIVKRRLDSLIKRGVQIGLHDVGFVLGGGEG